MSTYYMIICSLFHKAFEDYSALVTGYTFEIVLGSVSTLFSPCNFGAPGIPKLGLNFKK